MTDEQRTTVIREIAELVKELQEQQQQLDIDSVLTGLTQSALTAVAGADSAGITIASRDGGVYNAYATDDYPVRLDEIQHRCGEGPCLSAAWEHNVIRIDDIEAETRWARYCRDAATDTPIRSVLSFRLFASRRQMGALNFYGTRPQAFNDEAAELGLILATHMALAWNMVRRDEEFRSALASRDIIGQAKGMMMERFKINALQAFELLKRLSQSSNTPLAVVARGVVESEQHT